MKNVIIALVVLVAAASADGQYTDWQQGAMQGLKIGFHMGEMYTQASQGVNVTGFNSEVDKYNGWVQQNFGNDQALMMPKMSGPIDLSKPYIAVNKTNSNQIVHTIDGSNNMTGPTYTTNDGNLLPEGALDQLMGARGSGKDKIYKSPDKVDYLGGI